MVSLEKLVESLDRVRESFAIREVVPGIRRAYLLQEQEARRNLGEVIIRTLMQIYIKNIKTDPNSN